PFTTLFRSFRKRILNYQPAAQAQENHCSQDQARATADEKPAQNARTRARYHSGIVRSRHWGIGACYPAPPQWSIGRTGLNRDARLKSSSALPAWWGWGKLRGE